jgi:RimJ/RimL family protein N-acetyltransferase
MIRFATIEDLRFIMDTLESIKEDISDDIFNDVNEGQIKEVLLNGIPQCIILGNPELIGFVFILRQNAITVEFHTCILPNMGNKLAKLKDDLRNFIFDLGCSKLITQIPVYNRKAHIMAKRCGFEDEGINKKSFLKNGVVYDQYYMGLCKE